MEYSFPRNEGRSAVDAQGQWYRNQGAEIDRKRLGQYFTSPPLARLLAELALRDGTRSVVDPMCGDGNLLLAAAQLAKGRRVGLDHLDGIELDPVMAHRCRARLEQVSSGDLGVQIVEGNAFHQKSLASLRLDAYDLVIANPPYVRYQALSRSCGSTNSPGAKQIRAQLVQAFEGAGEPWRALANGYSGFADLSVPAWMLSASLVAPGGMLALVVPAAWRSREYADVLRYLMVSVFDVELIVEDTQPGWFSDALVRTNLVIARRRTGKETETLQTAEPDRLTKWLTIAPSAAAAESVVGAAFPGRAPERQLKAWLNERTSGKIDGLSLRSLPQSNEIAWLEAHASRRRWYSTLERRSPNAIAVRSAATLPDLLTKALGEPVCSFVSLGDIGGVSVNQGLRTGCNGFFYVDAIGDGRSPDCELIESRGLFPSRVFEAPRSALRPVLRRQNELPAYVSGSELSGRLLDLRGRVLDEDTSLLTYADMRHFRLIPDKLAEYVRAAAKRCLVEGDAETQIPSLSAVRTNARPARGETPPRFWYMIPDLVPRHVPDLFIARVSNSSPKVYSNRAEPVVVDANFSTITTESIQWTGPALMALLRSTWARSCMELLGTPMGGGALKLEASQLRRLPVPVMPGATIQRLHRIGRGGIGDNDVMEVDRLLLRTFVGAKDDQSSAHERLLALSLHLPTERRR